MTEDSESFLWHSNTLSISILDKLYNTLFCLIFLHFEFKAGEEDFHLQRYPECQIVIKVDLMRMNI